MEGDYYEKEIHMTNESSDPFPPWDVLLESEWIFPTRQRNGAKVTLETGAIQPGQTLSTAVNRHEVLAPGFAFLLLNYSPRGPGSVLYDSAAKEIEPLRRKPLADFRGVSIMELRTLAALYLAAISSTVAAIGFLLNLLFDWIPQLMPPP